MAQQYTNIFGRKPTRGVRPWLLLPKLIAAALYLGSLSAAAMIWWATPVDSPRFGSNLLVLRLLFTRLTVPALLLAMLLGLVLWLQMPGIFMRQRWFQVKMVLVFAGVPTGHFFFSSRLSALRAAIAADAPLTDLAAMTPAISVGFAVLLLWSATIIVLGRLKPRLGQDWGRAFRASVETRRRRADTESAER